MAYDLMKEDKSSKGQLGGSFEKPAQPQQFQQQYPRLCPVREEEKIRQQRAQQPQL
jgi:hypothetical protein